VYFVVRLEPEEDAPLPAATQEKAAVVPDTPPVEMESLSEAVARKRRGE
jgi:hypothetical protein